MNDYERKQAAKQARFAALAAKNERASQAHYNASRRAVEGIPLGQPILVGHHSEGRHRRALDRSDSAMRKTIEASDKATYYAQRAAAVGSSGVSSDDPDAVQKLESQLDGLQQQQTLMKAANRVICQTQTDECKIKALVAIGLPAGVAGKLLSKDFAGRIGFASYQLSNNNANIRRIETRIKELRKAQQRIDHEVKAAGYTYREDVTDNRVMFEFGGKPDESIRTLLKSQGFKWSPNRGAWVRHLNNAGVYAGGLVRARLDALASAST